MKRFQTILCGVLCTCMLAFLVACSASEGSGALPDELGVNAKGGTVASTRGTSDTVEYISMTFEDEACLESIKQNPDWQELPFTQELTKLVYSTLKNENGSPLFPVVSDGYYYFMDRCNQEGAPHEGAELADGNPHSFTVAVYSTLADALHYCAFDA